MSTIYSPVFCVGTRTWSLGKIEDHTARPLSEAEVTAASEVMNAADRAGVGVGCPLPLTNDLRWILGRPNFACHAEAEMLRREGVTIATKSEHEQAAVVHWMLRLYLQHGEKWRDEAQKYVAGHLGREKAKLEVMERGEIGHGQEVQS
jgi:hypothetical protein